MLTEWIFRKIMFHDDDSEIVMGIIDDTSDIFVSEYLDDFVDYVLENPDELTYAKLRWPEHTTLKEGIITVTSSEETVMNMNTAIRSGDFISEICRSERHECRLAFKDKYVLWEFQSCLHNRHNELVFVPQINED